jgi:hypothetical protein
MLIQNVPFAKRIEQERVRRQIETYLKTKKIAHIPPGVSAYDPPPVSDRQHKKSKKRRPTKGICA